MSEFNKKAEYFQDWQGKLRRQEMELKMALGKYNEEFSEWVKTWAGAFGETGQVDVLDLMLKARRVLD